MSAAAASPPSWQSFSERFLPAALTPGLCAAGGGWKAGHPSWGIHTAAATALAARGYVVFAPAYRLSRDSVAESLLSAALVAGALAAALAAARRGAALVLGDAVVGALPAAPTVVRSRLGLISRKNELASVK